MVRVDQWRSYTIVHIQYKVSLIIVMSLSLLIRLYPKKASPLKATLLLLFFLTLPNPEDLF